VNVTPLPRGALGLLGLALVVLGCQNSTPTPNAISATSDSAATNRPEKTPDNPPTPTASTSSSAAPTASLVPLPATFPAIDDACAVDADCTTTGLWGDCCGHCELRYSNTSYVTRATLHCGAHPAKCPPMACSWAMAKPACRAGHCKAWK
jgi:hypothetical protein